MTRTPLRACISSAKEITPSVDSPTNEVSEFLWITAQHARSEAVSGDWAYTPNSTVVNELRFGYSHYYQTFFEGTDASQIRGDYNFNGNTYAIPTGVTNPFDFGFPGITITGFNNGIGAGWPKQVGPDGVLQLVDHYSILHGKHAFMFGAEWLNNVSNEDVTRKRQRPSALQQLAEFL